jgi:hypothetical protein
LVPKGRWPGRDASGANVNVLNPGTKTDLAESSAVHGIEAELIPLREDPASLAARQRSLAGEPLL